jgi:hypothetical protein
MTSPRHSALEAVAEAIFLSSNEQAATHPKMLWQDASDNLKRKYRVVAQAALDALGPADTDDGWRHKKRGTTYKVIGTAEAQVEDCILEGHRVVVYRADSDGKLWVRPTEEFYDGRFERAAQPQRAKENNDAMS